MKSDLRSKQQRIAGLAAPIRAVAGNHAIAGSTAVSITRALIRHGASNQLAPFSGGNWGGRIPAGGPPNLRAFDPPPRQGSDPFGLNRVTAEFGRWVNATLGVRQVDAAIDRMDYDEAHAMSLSNTDPYRLDHTDEIAHEAIRQGAGNCGYIASTAFALMRHAAVAPIDLILILPHSGTRLFRNHTVAVLGIPDVDGNQKVPPYEQWADVAVLADAWVDEQSVPASLLAERWPRDTYQYYSYCRVRPGGE